MATATKTYTYTGTAEGWAYTPSTADDSGSAVNNRLENGCSGRNKLGAGYWQISGTFASIFGIDTGATVTGYTAASYSGTCTAYNVATDCTHQAFTVNDGTARTLIAAQTAYTASGQTRSPSVNPGITGLSLPATTSITLRLNHTSDTGANNAASARLSWDDVSLTVSYDLILEGVAESDGLSTAEATGASTAAADGASEGIATAEATGEGLTAETTVEGVGASDGAATAEAVGESTAESVAASEGAGDAQAEGAATAEAVGESASVATAEAVGESFGTLEGVGAAAGSSAAQAVGQNASEPVEPTDPLANCYFDGEYFDLYFEACRPAGGFGWGNLSRAERQRRKREEEEELADRLEVELAREGLVPPNPAAEVRITVREYPPMKRRTQRAVDYALKARTELAYQLAMRELAREQEEEEYALLLALAAA